MAPVFLQIGKKTVFPKVLKYLPNGFNVNLVGILGIIQNVVRVYTNKNIELLV